MMLMDKIADVAEFEDRIRQTLEESARRQLIQRVECGQRPELDYAEMARDVLQVCKGDDSGRAG